MENTSDTWENRISQASTIMGVTSQKLEDILNSPGFEISKEPHGLEMLSDEQITPFGDLRKLFCENNNIPIPKLRMAITYLRGNVKESTKKYVTMVDPDMVELQERFGIKFRMEDLDIEDLVPLYKPNKNNRITEALRKKFGDTPVIAFKPDTTDVAIEETINCLADFEQGYDLEDFIEVDGEPVKLYPIGVIPNQQVDEDPLFSGIALKRNRSVNNRVVWQDINLETRQFFRILAIRGDIDVNNRVGISQIINKTIKELRELFPEAYLQFKDKKSSGDLPKLTISLTAITNTTTSRGKTNNPFGINRKY